MRNFKKWHKKRLTKAAPPQESKPTFAELFDTIELEYGQDAKSALIKSIEETLSPYAMKVLSKGVMARKFPFNPDQSLGENDEENIARWQSHHAAIVDDPQYNDSDDATMADELKQHREAIPKMVGTPRFRALNKLAARTQSRPSARGDGKREFLLHRGMDRNEYNSIKVNHNRVSHKEKSSWTPHWDVANNFAKDYNTRKETELDNKDIENNPVTAWIHEDDIHSIPLQYGISSVNPGIAHIDRKMRGKNQFQDEFETIVQPHQSELHPLSGKKNWGMLTDPETLDQAITSRKHAGIKTLGSPLKSRINKTEAFLCGELDLKFNSKTETKMFDYEMIKSLKDIAKILINLSLSDLIKADYPKSPRHVGDTHPERPYVGGMWKDKLVWHHNKETASADDAKINDPIAIDAFLGTIKSPVHKALMSAVIKKVQKDPNRHVIQTWTGQYRPNGQEQHELRARNIKKLLSGDKSHTIDTSHPETLKITNDKSHTNYGIIDKPRYYYFSAGVKKNENFTGNDGPGDFDFVAGVFGRSGYPLERGVRLPKDSEAIGRSVENRGNAFGTGSRSGQDRLEKAIHPKDWSRITKKINPDAGLVVDHKPHAIASPAPAEYNQIHEDPKTIKSAKNLNNGISAKMIHKKDNNSDSYMAKPYHKKIESATKSWVKHPILGWATMATKALFNAGNIGHLAEDVSVHDAAGEPLTVHKFAKGFKEVGDIPDNSRNMKALPLMQISVMDYLSNNLDRHRGNLMVSDPDITDEEGYHIPLAIDHERNFQYNKQLKDHFGKRNYMTLKDGYERETPYNYMRLSAINRLDTGFEGYHELTSWWNEHGPKIKDEFLNQATHIKDPEIRQHLIKNFTARHDAMSEWSKNINETGDLWDAKSFNNDFPVRRNIPFQLSRITNKSLKALKNVAPQLAISSLCDIINKRRLTPNQMQTINDSMDDAVSRMQPAEMAAFYKHAMENPHLNTQKVRRSSFDPKQKVLHHLNDTHKPEHLQVMSDFIDSLPEEKRGILKYWGNMFKNKLDTQQLIGA